MRKTKLLTSIAALALVLGLGACERAEEEAGSGTTPDKEVVFGFELDGELNAIDGGYVLNDEGTPYLYELTYTSNLDDALKFTYEAGQAVGEYYISTEIDGATTWVAIVVSGSHTNVNYVTEKTPLYWNPTYECWGNEEQTHFLCQNATFECFYCSEITSWIDSSPIAALYYTDGSKVTGFAGTVIEEPQEEEVDLNDYDLIGTFDISKLTSSYTKDQTSGTSTHHLTTDELKSQLDVAWAGDDTTVLTAVTTADRIDDYNPTDSGWKQGEQSLGYLKTGASSNKGEMVLTTSSEVSAVSITCHSWRDDQDAQKVAVNGGATKNASVSGTATALDFAIEASTTLDLVFTNRVFIASISLYAAK